MKRMVAFAAVLLLAIPAWPQQISSGAGPALSSARRTDPVRFLFPEQVTVPAGKSSVVELHFRVADGLHINSHTPRSSLLIPTNFVMPEEPGVRVGTVDFPAGTDYSFSFSPREKLSVYVGEFVLTAHVTAQPGQHLLEAKLRYQACDSNSCYPPRTIPVAFNIVAR